MARDAIHRATRVALEKDGWTISHDPIGIRYADLGTYADLGATGTLAERTSRRIAVEVKSFVGASMTRELAIAIGQFEIYRALLQKSEPDRELWLAVPREIYEDYFRRKAVQWIVASCELRILTINVAKEEIDRWIS
jgi:hypothetical protein